MAKWTFAKNKTLIIKWGENMDNPNIDNPNPKKEEYVIILDYLKFGYVNPERPTAHGKPIAQAIGVDKFTFILNLGM